MSYPAWRVERRADGVIIVRVPSRRRNGHLLPDAVFSFRAGDPQFAKWDQYLRSPDAVTAVTPEFGSPSSPAHTG